ncbi:uncharacterized protein LOC132262687 [Phlebotomus argentipes]|uniref:uncharacterized protein LOC132262687 n=1 Tax=Phlebotomus argentipes TaxID=94469 RepID=UPI0028929D52|nr:uncharacterized protein LOC132262687 [Phlebotomus argentipes]
MYRQVRVAPEDCDLQRIFWRESRHQPVQIYRLTTVTYGTACAPFLATRVLKQMALDNADDYPDASEAIINGFYMDDLLSGAMNIESAITLQSDIHQILDSGGFPLRKWASNAPEVLQNIPPEQQALTEEEVLAGNKLVPLLGLQWLPGLDQLSLVIEDFVEASSRRDLCASAAKVFDPLGFIAPVTAKLRMLTQSLWDVDIDWDDPLPEDIRREFLIIRAQLSDLTKVNVPRLMIKSPSQINLHGFADASSKGYGAVVYAVCVDDNLPGQAIFVASKSRVATRQPVTMDRLHLNSACLLCHLIEKLTKDLGSTEVIVKAWTSSEIALQWIQRESSEYKTYVANRLEQIHKIIPGSVWQWTPIADNPASCLAQGLTPKELIQHPLWRHGPKWLVQGESQWPQRKEIPHSVTGEEKLVSQTLFTQHPIESTESIEFFKRFSSAAKLTRVTAQMLRWRNFKENRHAFGIELTVQEIAQATMILVKKAQRECFAEEIHCLQRNQPIKAGSKLSKLVPFLDDCGVLRVKGRIQNSRLEFEARHPAILSGVHPFTLKLIEAAHVFHLHAGTALTQSIMRAQYWIIGERRSVKKVIHQCISCFRAKPRLEQPLMGNLPAYRVRQARAFINTGCDFAGPLQVRVSRLRKAIVCKAYICLFVCMATKAVHLEAVSDLSTEAFLAAQRRFRSRRGICQNIYCDNASNFVGAVTSVDPKEKRKQLLQHQQRVIRFMSESGTQFHFIPAYSPTFGGLWERGIGNVKFHLKRVLGDTILTFEELTTVLTEVEALLNSRPLCPLSSEPDDLDPLTPAHFLGSYGPPIEVPPLDTLPEKLNHLTRWRFLQRLSQEFGRRWQAEYITTLQQRPKWSKTTENLAIGDLVLIKIDNLRSFVWSMGRVTEIHPGSDGVVRVVTVRTSSGLTKRAVNKLAKLPLQDELKGDSQPEENVETGREPPFSSAAHMPR